MPTLAAKPRIAVFVVTLLLAGGAHGANELLLQLPPIKGESTLDKYKDWSSLSSLQWGAGNSVNFSHGGIGVGKPSASDIVWTQTLDSTYPQLMTALTASKGVAAEFRALRPSGNGKLPAPYLSLKTDTTLVDGVSFVNDSVSASAAFGKIEMSWDPAGLGDKASKVTTVWDLGKGKATTTGAGGPGVPVASSLGTGSSGGDTRMFLRLGGGTTAVAGGSTFKGYENWIQIASAQFGAGRGVSIGGGGAGGGSEASAPSFSALTWSQPGDATLPVVLGLLANGSLLNEATLEFVRGSGDRAQTFMQMVMQDVVVTGLSLSAADGGDGVSTSESIAFGKFSQTYWTFDEQGRADERGITFGYDSTRQKTIGRITPTSTTGFGKGQMALGAAAQEVELPPIATPVPEPQQWALLMAGLALLGALARRRRVA